MTFARSLSRQVHRDYDRQMCRDFIWIIYCVARFESRQTFFYKRKIEEESLKFHVNKVVVS